MSQDIPPEEKAVPIKIPPYLYKDGVTEETIEELRIFVAKKERLKFRVKRFIKGIFKHPKKEGEEYEEELLEDPKEYLKKA